MKINKKEEYFCKDYVEIIPKGSTNPPPPKEITKEDEVFLTQNTGTPKHQCAKRTMFETINEIIHAYPSLQKTTKLEKKKNITDINSIKYSIPLNYFIYKFSTPCNFIVDVFFSIYSIFQYTDKTEFLMIILNIALA